MDSQTRVAQGPVKLVRLGPNNFNTLRLALALLVVWSHSFAIHLGSEKSEWVSLLLGGVYNAGNVAVMGFFIISGFLISESWQRSRSLRSYLSKRVRRIYPGYMVATTICALVVAPLFGGAFPNPWTTLGWNFLLQNDVPNAFPTNLVSGAVNGSLWSIPYEFWCYIGVAALGSVLLARRPWLVSLCALLILGQIIQDLTGKRPGLGPLAFLGWPYFWTKMGPCFLLGMIVYAYRDKLPRSFVLLAALSLAAVLACHFSATLATILVAPTLAYAVMMLAFSEQRLPDAATYGDLSYGAYLYAFPIQQMLQATIGKNWGLPLFIAASMLLALGAGCLSWHLVERRFMKKPNTTAPEVLVAT